MNKVVFAGQLHALKRLLYQARYKTDMSL